MKTKTHFVLRLATLLLIFFAGPIWAKSPDWQTHKYGYFASGESLNSILMDFSASYGIPAVVSEKLTAPINGSFPESSAEEFLGLLASITSMKWYFDGDVLHFYRSDETAKTVISLNNLSPSELYGTISVLPWWQSGAHWQALDDYSIVFVGGAPKFVETVESVSKLLDASAKSSQEEEFSISVFRLKFASVSDYNYQYRGQTKSFPGVLSLLEDQLILRGPNSAGSLDGGGAHFEPNNTESDGDHITSDNEEKPTQRDSNNALIKPFIRADNRLNAIIIGDTKENISIYKRLIDSIDVPIRQVEIDVTIAHMQTDAFFEFGANWSHQANGRSVVVNGVRVAANIIEAGEIRIVAGTAESLLTTIRSLERKGRAKIISRPSILTLENFEAVFDSNSTFHVRLAGVEDVELVPITVGTLLRVTPHIQLDEEDVSIRLDIHIEDGQQSSQVVDNIPVLTNTVVNTQATVRENESLVIGGFYYDAEEETNTSVPILRNIPFVKKLFQSTREDSRSTIRVFLITPKLADLQKPIGRN